MGNWRYCNDDRFDPYLLSAYDGERRWVGHPRDFNWEAVRGATLLAHNAGFERAVTRRLIELGQAPDWVLNNEWHCTADMSSYLANVRALDSAVEVLEGRKLNKGIRDWMSGKTWDDAVKAGKADELKRYAIADTVECHGLWTNYSGLWPAFEQRVSDLTIHQCARGVCINVDLLNEYVEKLRIVIFELEKSLPWTDRGAKPSSPIAIAEECRKVGIPCPPLKKDDEEGHDRWVATFSPRYPWVAATGQWRQLCKLLASLETMQERLRPDNTIDFSLLYFGAHTGRWSGGGSGLNFQNFRKVPLFLKNNFVVAPPPGISARDFKAWIAAETDYAIDIRRLLIPRPGKKFIISDLSQIEPRVLNWLAGNLEFLRLVSEGMSPYEVHARKAMGWTGGKLKDENPDLYQLAKIQVLQLGYQSGWEKFQSTALTEYNVVLNEQQSRESVETFRDGNPLIVNLWEKLQAQIQLSGNRKEDMELTLPSGRSLRYRHVRRELRSKRNSETGNYEKRFTFVATIGEKRKEIYGGLTAENITQAISRDVFCGHALELEAQVSDVIFHVHDEATNEVDQDVTVADVEHVMSKCPEWMPGLPVAAEAKEVPYYTK